MSLAQLDNIESDPVRRALRSPHAVTVLDKSTDEVHTFNFITERSRDTAAFLLQSEAGCEILGKSHQMVVDGMVVDTLIPL